MQPHMEDVLAEFDRALAKFAPTVLQERKRPPVSEPDLERLRELMAPYELPDDLVALLRWSDGFDEGLCPGIKENFASAKAMATQLETLRKIVESEAERFPWPSGWLPYETFSDLQMSVDLSRGAPCPMLQAEWGADVIMQAPSLAAAVAIGIDALEAGVPLIDPEMWDENATFQDGAAWHSEIDALRIARYDWSDWPYEREIAAPDQAGWPAEWR